MITPMKKVTVLTVAGAVEETRGEIHHRTHTPHGASDRHYGKRNPICRHHGKLDRCNRRQGEIVKSRTGNAVHLLLVHKQINVYHLCEQLKQHSAQHAEWEYRETFEKTSLGIRKKRNLKCPKPFKYSVSDQHRNADDGDVPCE